MEYSVAIRTLGKAGEKYQRMLDSLKNQTIQPKAIYVYIADGYPIPEETIGKEKYIYTKKGMVAQRAQKYNEVDTEFILFLDDDIYLPPNGVEMLYTKLIDHNADVISPDVFANAERNFAGRVLMGLSGRMTFRRHDETWAYKIKRNAGYSYNACPIQDIYLSQSNAGPCFFCRKAAFLQTHFDDELWLDNMPYAMGEDQVMYYKMYLLGFKELTYFHSGIEHMDAGSTMQSLDKDKTRVYCDFRFKLIFWHRFIYTPEKNLVLKILDVFCIIYPIAFTLLISLVKFRFDFIKIKSKAIKDAISFIKSPEYKSLPRITKVIS